ncbi:mitotic spindle checkpoint protein MAD1 [Selaginella moellendorffii]|uniref:mitotic spindle checkpoint protein MAD1 n=1 Tax=Selaginella moellendorffii TaxID=88036 RepID=UPI000D1CA681|nr:mitotic spindle checkpoint protein MAD1 [Selaginella moellendorffii]|eukprot:XP_024527425.1 mitotic spindle checkpoint protein MAD1 [Selaginella moellendorffii]
MMTRTPAAKRPRVLELLEREIEVAHSPAARSPVLDDGMAAMVPYDQRNLELAGSYPEDDDAGDHDRDWDSMRCSYKCRNMVKSELLETLDRREKQVVEYEAAFKQLKARESENQSLIARVKSLEQSLAAATCREEALRTQRAEEVTVGEERFRKQLLRCNEIQEKLMAEIRSKSEAETTAKEAENEVSSLKNELASLRDSSAKEIRRLERDVQGMEENNEFCMSKMNAENDACRRETECVSEELSYLRVQHGELEEKLNNILQEKMNLERELATASSKLSNTRMTDSQEAEAVINSLREELKHQSAEISEAKKLKANYVKQQAVEEQLDTLRKRAEQAEAKLVDYADVKLRISALECDLNAWEDVLKAIPGNVSRDQIPEKLVSLQRELLVRLSENGGLKAKVEELQLALARTLMEKQESESAAASARQHAEGARGRISRLERQVVSLTRERDGVKAILASYDEEESFLLQQHKAASSTVLATPEKSKQRRIEELESLLASSQETIKVIEKELEESIGTSKERQIAADKLSADLEAARSKISSLERESLQLRQEIGILEGKLACGEFDPSKTKVLKLRTSLDTRETSHPVVTSIPVESATHEQIASILESKDKIAMLTGKVGALEQEISTLKKRENRYMQVFAEKAFTFRTACGLIFGYEILMNEKPDSAVTFFKLRSVYSRDKEYETLEFQYTANGHAVGRIDMLANDYTTSPEIDRQVTTFLQGFKSIPAFIANLTLELFNKGTIG